MASLPAKRLCVLAILLYQRYSENAPKSSLDSISHLKDTAFSPPRLQGGSKTHGWEL